MRTLGTLQSVSTLHATFCCLEENSLAVLKFKIREYSKFLNVVKRALSNHAAVVGQYPWEINKQMFKTHGSVSTAARSAVNEWPNERPELTVI